MLLSLLVVSVARRWPKERGKYKGGKFDQVLFNLEIAGKYCKGSD